MKNNIYNNLFEQIILPKYGSFRDKDYDDFLLQENVYPHDYSILNRTNLTYVNTLTIDPEGCKDADDAFSIFYVNDKLYLAIHIADPTDFINLNSNLWNNILHRNITHYPSNNNPIHLMPDKIIKMASLSFDDDSKKTIKKAISIITEIDTNTYLPTNNVTLDFTRVSIDKDYCFSYDSANMKLDEIKIGLLISKALFNRRSTQTIGTKLSQINKAYSSFDGENIKYDNENVRNLKNMIAEFAIFANSFVGEYLKINLNGLGIFRTLDSGNLSEINSNVSGDELLNQIILNGLSADYIANIKPHDLVGTPVYCHFTSPIRRLADCICHYLLKSIKLARPIPWTKEQLDVISNNCHYVSKKERSIQHGDKKFRMIQLFNNLILKKNKVEIGFIVNSYTGMFLNCIIDKLFINGCEYNIQMSYTLRITNMIVKYDLNLENFSKTISINSVTPFKNYDEGTIPELDDYLKNNLFI